MMEFFAITTTKTVQDATTHTRTRMVKVMSADNGRLVPEALAPLEVIEDLTESSSPEVALAEQF
jgi:hypothetical protein